MSNNSIITVLLAGNCRNIKHNYCYSIIEYYSYFTEYSPYTFVDTHLIFNSLSCFCRNILYYYTINLSNIYFLCHSTTLKVSFEAKVIKNVIHKWTHIKHTFLAINWELLLFVKIFKDKLMLSSK